MPKKQTPPRDFRSQWLKGVLELCILGVLAEDEAYGYEVAQTLQAAGLGEVKGGSLYPALARLEQDKLVVTAWRTGEQGPNRKYYSITETGRSRLLESVEEWSQFVLAAKQLMNMGKEFAK